MTAQQTSVTPSILAAAQAGNIGRVIRLSRQAQGLTQEQAGDRTGHSQSGISRLERGRPTDVDELRRVAGALGIPPILLGLAEQPSTTHNASPKDDDQDPVKRRQFLAAAAALAEAAAIPRSQGDSVLTSLHAITAAQRRMDSLVPSRELADSAGSHLELAKRRHAQATGRVDRANGAAAVSEAAGFKAWLHWDMHDVGSARSFYGVSIQAAEATGDPTLHAYMLGSLATLAAYEGDAVEGLALLQHAAAALGEHPPAIATAWLASLEAVAQADAGNARRTWEALDRADEAVELIPGEEAPPWPWVFVFDHAKVARHRLTCAARLRRPDIAYAAAAGTGDYLSSGHRKQRALSQLDLATAYLHDREPERAFGLAGQALTLGRETRSGRVVEAARRFRRAYDGSPAGAVVQNFDRQLYGASF